MGCRSGAVIILNQNLALECQKRYVKYLRNKMYRHVPKDVSPPT